MLSSLSPTGPPECSAAGVLASHPGYLVVWLQPLALAWPWASNPGHFGVWLQRLAPAWVLASNPGHFGVWLQRQFLAILASGSSLQSWPFWRLALVLVSKYSHENFALCVWEMFNFMFDCNFLFVFHALYFA